MSFILDALKKSEHERQRQSMPGLVESNVARPRPKLPLWALALCLLLGVNLVVLLAVLVHGRMTTASESGRPSMPLSSTAVAPRTALGSSTDDRHFSPLDNAPVYAPEIAVPNAAPVSDSRRPTPPTLPASPASPVSPTPPANAAPHAVRRRDPLLNDEDFKARDEELLPSINELNLTGPQALPELHLDVHVFATRAAERFVFINMRKYHEGATLQEGPTLERIRRDGVILDYHGIRFLLPRQ